MKDEEVRNLCLDLCSISRSRKFNVGGREKRLLVEGYLECVSCTLSLAKNDKEGVFKIEGCFGSEDLQGDFPLDGLPLFFGEVRQLTESSKVNWRSVSVRIGLPSGVSMTTLSTVVGLSYRCLGSLRDIVLSRSGTVILVEVVDSEKLSLVDFGDDKTFLGNVSFILLIQIFFVGNFLGGFF